MKQWQMLVSVILIPALALNLRAAQHKCRLHIKIVASDTRKITPAMVCITNVNDATIHVPPAGELAAEPSYPDIFFKGIDFSSDKNWVGPIRKMSGKGEVNGQRTYVYGTSPTLPYWPEPAMYQVSGDFTIDLGPGRWRISIQHGNEYVPKIEEVTITGGQNELERTFVLERWINLPQLGWYSGDVHAHHPLDKQSYRDYVLQLAQAEDLHVLNMLQMGDRKHTYFTPQGFGPEFRVCIEDVCIVSGQEEPRSDYGHIIGLNTGSLARDTAHYNHYDIVFDKVHRKADALVGYAHFAYGGEGVREGLALYAPTGAIDFVEMLQNTKLNTSDYYDYLNLGFRFTAAAGSDFPWGSTVGDGRTFVYTGKSFSADKWFAGLRAGNTFVSNGPALFIEAEGQIPGTEIVRDKGAEVRIKVKAFSNAQIGVIEKIELMNNDGLLFTTLNARHLDSVEMVLSHTLLKSQWLTASVHCSNGALAHTSPVYFIVEGKPLFDVVKGPKIIQTLLDVLEKAKAAEIAKPVADRVILEKIEAAQQFYRRLRTKMEEG